MGLTGGMLARNTVILGASGIWFNNNYNNINVLAVSA